ncbi:hypothetical protein PFISCL1PPCAC_6483, partial [Pristionchus fissidentatus]
SDAINDCCSLFQECDGSQCKDEQQRCIDNLTVGGNTHCRALTDHIVERDSLDNSMPGFEKWNCHAESIDESRRLHAMFASGCHRLINPVSECCSSLWTSVEPEKECMDGLLNYFDLEEPCRPYVNKILIRERIVTTTSILPLNTHEPSIISPTIDDDFESTSILPLSIESSTTDDVDEPTSIFDLSTTITPSDNDELSLNVLVYIRRIYKYTATYVEKAGEKAEKNPTETAIVIFLMLLGLIFTVLGICSCCIVCTRISTKPTEEDHLDPNRSISVITVRSPSTSN